MNRLSEFLGGIDTGATGKDDSGEAPVQTEVADVEDDAEEAAGQDSAEETPASEAPAADKADEPKADAAKELETLSKRFKDTQAALTRATQELAALKKRGAEEEKPWFAGDADPADADPVKGLREEVDRLRAESAKAKWEAIEAPVRAKNPDYQRLVYEVLEPAMAEDEKLRKQFEADVTPENALRLARKVELRRKLEEDPEGYLTSLIEERMSKSAAAPAAKKSPASETLAGVVSEKAPGTAEAVEDTSPLDFVVRRRYGGRRDN